MKLYNDLLGQATFCWIPAIFLFCHIWYTTAVKTAHITLALWCFPLQKWLYQATHRFQSSWFPCKLNQVLIVVQHTQSNSQSISKWVKSCWWARHTPHSYSASTFQLLSLRRVNKALWHASQPIKWCLRRPSCFHMREYQATLSPLCLISSYISAIEYCAPVCCSTLSSRRTLSFRTLLNAQDWLGFSWTKI